MKNTCPVCKGSNIQHLFNTIVPTLQNRVYDSMEEALHCSSGTIELTHCSTCNFTFNAGFDEHIIVYDEKYDNAVPSQLFTRYYQTICRYLYEKYDLEKGTVYDIGCGKGTFLKMLCSMYPSVKGIGIDPSYEGNLAPMDNLVFIREFFKTEHVTERPGLILSRHVFEHIEHPRDFLAIIQEPVKSYPDLPVFIEVPDFAWIVENKTFWDLCYEHCNYFSERSIETMFDNSWSSLDMITRSFGDQYLWVEGIFNPTQEQQTSKKEFVAIPESGIEAFVASIHTSKDKVLQIIRDYKATGYSVIVWGMATKGVIFTNSIDKERALVDLCIDINKEKQDKYAPLSAHLIQAPETLAARPSGEKCLVIVMNTNYAAEIKAEVSKYGLEAYFMDAHGSGI